MFTQSSMTFAVVFGNRDFFPSYLVNESRQQLAAVLEQQGIRSIMLGADEGTAGGVSCYHDAKLAAALLKEHQDEINGVLVVLPNFGDEKAVADSIRLSGIHVPVLVQAEEDDLDKMGLDTRRDSFCGKISLCNNLRQYGIPYSLTQRHVCQLTSLEFAEDLAHFEQVCRLYGAMKRVRIGAIGARPASFNTVRYSEKMLEQMGVSVETLDLSEVLTRLEQLPDNDLRIDEKLQQLMANADCGSIPADKLHKMAKLFVVITDWVQANDIDAVAFQCWSSLQQTLGVNVCSIMSVMSGELLPNACEVDVMGALSMYALSACSLTPAAIADWNNNFGDDPDKCVLFHCGNFPSAMLESATMGTADIIGTTVGKENTCGAIHGRLKAGPITYLRLSTDELTGQVKAYVGEGRAVADPLDTVGCRAVVQVPQLENLLAYICNNGFEHHVAFSCSTTAAVLQEVLTRYLGLECYFHGKEA